MKTRLVLFLIVLATVVPSAAQTTITGHIADARTGESLIGASVVPKSSNELGAVTDIDGNFTLVTNVELPLTLSVQYVGYRPQEVDVYDASEPVDIQLSDNASRLNEVVVIGYGEQKRLELTVLPASSASVAVTPSPVVTNHSMSSTDSSSITILPPPVQVPRQVTPRSTLWHSSILPTSRASRC